MLEKNDWDTGRSLAHRFRGAAANQTHQGSPAHVELWGESIPVKLYDQWPVKR